MRSTDRVTVLARLSAWIGLAASPAFLVMAASAALHRDHLDTLCGTPVGPGLDGMSVMYVLMAAAHAPAWINRLARRRPGVSNPCSD